MLTAACRRAAWAEWTCSRIERRGFVYARPLSSTGTKSAAQLCVALFGKVAERDPPDSAHHSSLANRGAFFLASDFPITEAYVASRRRLKLRAADVANFPVHKPRQVFSSLRLRFIFVFVRGSFDPGRI